MSENPSTHEGFTSTNGGPRFYTRIMSVHDVPADSITPTIAGVPTGVSEFGDGTNDVFHLRMVAGYDAPVEASNRLKGLTDGAQLRVVPGSEVFFFGEEITTLAIIAVGDVTSATLAAGEQVAGDETAANFQIAMREFVFVAGEGVNAVQLRASARYSGSHASIGTAGSPIATANSVTVQVRGLVL